MKKIFILSYSLFFISYSLFSQDVYPTHWWVGMKMNRIQLILHSNKPDINLYADKLVVRSSSPDLKIKKINKVENRRYLIIDVEDKSSCKEAGRG